MKYNKEWLAMTPYTLEEEWEYQSVQHMRKVRCERVKATFSNLFKKIMRFFEDYGYRRAANNLRREGMHHEAEMLLRNCYTRD